jgi:hypothetical protein
MRVELSIEGGFAYFPGLAQPIVVEATQLSAADATELRRLCGAALAAGGKARMSPLASFPDARRYQLAIDVDGVTHELTVADPISPQAVADLIEFVNRVARGVARR